MSDVIHGACLCEEVAFDVLRSDDYPASSEMGMCHCTTCQRWSGGPGVPFLAIPPEHLKVIRGQELIGRYRGLGRSVRSFCRRCGSSLYTDAGHMYYVSAGVLRGLEQTASFHIYVADKAAWDQIAGDAPQFAELPTDRPVVSIGAGR